MLLALAFVVEYRKVLIMLSVSVGSSRCASIGNKMATAYTEQPWFVLSAATHYNLMMSDDPAISHYYSFEADHTNGLAIAIPDGCVDILFDCEPDNPSAHVCGSTMEAREAELQHRHRYFGVRFAQGVLPNFLDASATDLVDQRCSLLNLVPEFEPIFAQIVEETVFTSQVSMFQNFYVGKAPRVLSGLTANAIRVICEHKGDVRIKQLEEVTGYTSRTLQRQFQSDMGMSPKTFSRIVRCQSAIHEINSRDSVVFSELACDLGFSDQPHFLREFKKLVSTTPMNYQRQVQQSDYRHRIRYS